MEKAKKQIFYLSIVVLILLCMLIFQNGKIVGKASQPSRIWIYGEITPRLQDGAKISFKLNGIEIASTELKQGKYGYEPKLFLKMDDPLTTRVEGYSKGDTVKVYIEDIEIAEISYFEEMPKNFEIPASKRADVSNKIAAVILCTSDWECTEWSECINNIQTRTCIDKNKCRFEKGKPDESRTCIAPEIEMPAVIEKEIWKYILSALIIIFVCIWFITYELKKSKKTKKRKK